MKRALINVHEFGLTGEGETARKPHYKRNLKESWASSSKGNNTRKSSLPWIQTENVIET